MEDCYRWIRDRERQGMDDEIFSKNFPKPLDFIVNCNVIMRKHCMFSYLMMTKVWKEFKIALPHLYTFESCFWQMQILKLIERARYEKKDSKRIMVVREN